MTGHKNIIPYSTELVKLFFHHYANHIASMLTFPNAKINIGLNITAKRNDGYHDLETVFYPIGIQDVLEIKPLENSDKDWDFQIAGQQVTERPEDNLVIKVFKDLQKEFDLPAVDIYLQKKIPTGAGLGGGSSDAAFMMKTLNEMFELHLSTADMERRIAAYGADCAFFIKNTCSYATGIGDRLQPIDLSLKGYNITLVKPSVAIPTREAYSGITPQLPSHRFLDLISQPVETWKGQITNDFEKHLFILHPQLAAIKQTLYDMGALYASMSGSGSVLYGIFKEKPECAERVFGDCRVFQHQLG